jgi:hypothetical protein
LKPKFLILLTAIVLFAASANAGVIAINSPGAIAANTVVDWGYLGDPYTSVTSPFTVDTPLVSFLVSQPGGAFERRDQSYYGYGRDGSWFGHFAGGEHLLFTQDDPDTYAGFGPMAFTFEAPIFGFLVQMDNNSFAAPTYYIQAFDGDSDLGTFQVDQAAAGACCANTAPYIGVLSDQANITRVVISGGGDRVWGDYANNFAIGGPLIEAQGATATVPEPGSLALLGTGILWIMTLACRRRRGFPTAGPTARG